MGTNPLSFIPSFLNYHNRIKQVIFFKYNLFGEFLHRLHYLFQTPAAVNPDSGSFLNCFQRGVSGFYSGFDIACSDAGAKTYEKIDKFQTRYLLLPHIR